MKENVMYPGLASAMAYHGEQLKDIAQLIGKSIAVTSRKLNGYRELTIGEIEILCKHYNMDYYELFTKKGE